MTDAGSAMNTGPQELEDVVMWGPDGEPFRYVGAMECNRCEFWFPAFEDALEVDEDGTVRAWSGIATADCDDCRRSMVEDFYGKTFVLEWSQKVAS